VKVLLLRPDTDEPPGPLPANAPDLIQDLELGTLFTAMAGGDPFLFGVARDTVLAGLVDPAAIAYRQAVLRDCLAQEPVIRRMYGLTIDAAKAEKSQYIIVKDSPEALLNRSVRLLRQVVEILQALRLIAGESMAAFESPGFRRFFRMVERDLDDAYFREVEEHLKRLSSRRGFLISATLGPGGSGQDFVFREPRRRGFAGRVGLAGGRRYSYVVPSQDDASFQALSAIKARGLNSVANALAQSVDSILGFFAALRGQLAFYLGCLNLRDRLLEKGMPVCLPDVARRSPSLVAEGLYDACLALVAATPVVGNDIDADGKGLVMVTGANQGGKSTFLRSLGLAQLMMQSGMFVAARSFTADVRSGVFTHFKREEDVTMKSGKFEEELTRMQAVARLIRPGGLLLCNESFSSTNEREGSEVASQVVRAFVDSGIKVAYVTHLYDLAQRFYQTGTDMALFLKAERREDGSRTFRVVPGAPEPTSYGQDLYQRIFGASA